MGEAVARAKSAEAIDVGGSNAEPKEKRTRKTRPYPSASFEETLELGEAIHEHASGGRVRRLTLLEKMAKSPTSSATRDLITNSGKYGVTTGSYKAESLELTTTGALASDPTKQPGDRLAARFQLAIKNVAPFNTLYEAFVGKRLPSHEVMRDVLAAEAPTVDDARECVDLFVVNAKFLGLLRSIGGVETLVSPDDVGASVAGPPPTSESGREQRTEVDDKQTSGVQWPTICFFIAPIGAEGSEERKHSDLVLRQLVEPAHCHQRQQLQEPSLPRLRP